MTISEQNTRPLLIAFSSIVVASLLIGIAGNWYWLAGIPVVVLVAYLALVDFKKLFFLLLALLPLTVEVWLPNGTVTDLPTEPMMVMMMGIYLLYVLRQGKVMDAGFLRHPISLMLMLHLGWMFFAVITSEAFVISFKFFLAKIWYVTTWFFLAGTLMRDERDMKALIWCVLPTLVFTIFYVTWQHSQVGFSFAEVNSAMYPFYRNKVAYAFMLTVFLPFVLLGRGWYKRYSLCWWLLLGGGLLVLMGIQLSYTRAAYGMLAMAAGSWFVIKWRMMKLALAGASLLAILYIYGMLNHNNYLDQKPTYEKTITHEDFGDLLEATTAGRDVSVMERVYRWVAGGHMVAERPGLGFGPGTFTTFYKTYTLSGFTTYVSANKDGSGIHCYYLMTAVEQGLIGALLFITLVFVVLLKGEAVYHQTTNPDRRRILMIAMLTSIIIDGLQFMNDMVETDKVGSFFFLCMALIVNVDLANKRDEAILAAAPPKIA